MSFCFAIARAIHFAACLAVMSAWAFDRLVMRAPDRRERDDVCGAWGAIARRILVISLPIALLSGSAWLILAAGQMSDLPVSQAIRWPVLRLVLSQTRFGVLWQWRAGIWIGCADCARIPDALPTARRDRCLARLFFRTGAGRKFSLVRPRPNRRRPAVAFVRGCAASVRRRGLADGIAAVFNDLVEPATFGRGRAMEYCGKAHAPILRRWRYSPWVCSGSAESSTVGACWVPLRPCGAARMEEY